MTEPWSFTIASEPACVGPLGEGVRGACLALGMTGDGAGEVELAVVEAVNNAIEHAYAGDGAGTVEVVLICRQQRLTVEVRDTGRPMPAGVLAGARAPDFDPTALATLPEGGMGLHIVKTLMEAVSYERRDGCNVLHMERPLGE